MKRLALLLLPLLSSTPALAADLDWQSYRKSEAPPPVIERDRVVEYDRYYEPPPVYAEPRVYVERYAPRDYAYGYGYGYRPWDGYGRRPWAWRSHDWRGHDWRGHHDRAWHRW
jgi:hypothetical protein